MACEGQAPLKALVVTTWRNYGYVHTVPVVKRSVAESVPDRAAVHTRNAAFEASFCSGTIQLRSTVESGTFRIGQVFEMVRIKSEHFYRSRIATESRFGK